MPAGAGSRKKTGRPEASGPARIASYAAAVASGLLLIGSFPPTSLWPLGWIALAPLGWAVLRAADTRSAANCGAVTGLVFYSVALHWFTRIFGYPVAAAFWCIFAIWIALFAALLHRLYRRLAVIRSTILRDALLIAGAGILWSGIEYLRCELWPLANAWLALGYSQWNALPLLQLCSIGGVYGLGSLIVAVNVGLVLLARGRRLVPALLAVAVAIAASLGAHRVRTLKTEEGRRIKVALVQSESFSIEKLAALSTGSEGRNSHLIVWPESAFMVPPEQSDRYRRLVADRVASARATLVTGAASVRSDDPQHPAHDNFAWVIGPGGRLLGRYDKLHPIPFVEKGLTANPDPQPVDSPAGRLGVQICYDLDFENGSRRMAQAGAELLVVPNLDPWEWGRTQHLQHSAMAPIRAVESGLWLVRAASSGKSKIIDPTGRIRAELVEGTEGVLHGDAFVRPGGTIYTRFGWRRTPALFVLLLILTGWLLLPSARRR